MIERRCVGQDGQMQERPAPVWRLDSLLSASVIAHEAIFDLRHELRLIGRGGREVDDLLTESAQIALTDLPGLAARAISLAARWEEQSVLDPGAAQTTLRDLAAELKRIEPEIQGLVERQREIAARLRAMLDG